MPRLARLVAGVNPLIVLLAFLPVLGWSIGFEEMVHQRRTETLAARNAYALALAETRAQLAGQLAKVTGDTALIQNLKWKLVHSVNDALEGRLSRGVVDQLTLIDGNCTELGRATAASGQSAATPCPARHTGFNADGSFWVASPNGPLLGLTSPLVGVEGGHAIAMVRLDDNWLGHNPELKERMAALGLSIGGESGVVLLREGVDGRGNAVASLVTDRTFDRFLQSRIGRELATGDPLLWPCLAAAFICALLALSRERAHRAVTKDALADFLAWSRSLTSAGEFVLPGKTAPVVAGVLKPDLATAKKLVNQALRVKNDTVTGLNAKIQSLENQLKARDADLTKHRQRLSELAELDSLALQLQQTTAAFLRRMEELQQRTEDLDSIFNAAVAGQSQALFNLLQSWRLGVDERGARKFLRSLAETPGAEPERTQLDDQLAEMASLASRVTDAAVAGAALTPRIVETAAFASRLAGLWHALALKTHAEQICTSLAVPIEEAQNLVRLNPAFGDVPFPKLVGDIAPGSLPELPKPIWISALYHVYLAMAELGQGGRDGHAGVSSRLRQDGDKILFVIQATGDDFLPKRGEKQVYHLEITRAILAPFNISLCVLPALDGPFPVALSWSATSPYRRAATPPLPLATKSASAEAAF